MGIAPVIMPMLTDATNLTTFEEPTIVNTTLLKKALAPPVNIRNFFKPSKPAVTEKTTLGNSKNMGVTSTHKCESKYFETRAFCKPPNDAKNKTNSMKGTASMSENNKRPSESSFNQIGIKRCKRQGSILNSLNTSTVERKRCPICKKIFGVTTNNKEVNDHIDSCLIK